jgi:hypothetical protein
LPIVSAHVNEDLKKRIRDDSRRRKKSVSKMAGEILENHYFKKDGQRPLRTGYLLICPVLTTQKDRPVYVDSSVCETCPRSKPHIEKRCEVYTGLESDLRVEALEKTHKKTRRVKKDKKT